MRGTQDLLIEDMQITVEYISFFSIIACTSPILSTCPLHTNRGCGKKEAHTNWSMVIPEKKAPVTAITLRTTDPVPADSRQ